MPTKQPNNNNDSEPLQQPDKLDEYKQLLKQQNEYATRIGTLMTVQKKLLRRKEGLTKFREPILFLQRTSGVMEIYDNAKDKEFKVPDLPDGVEKRIILGKQWQVEIPYAGRTFRAYWCHEDWAFPHQWSRVNLYTGRFPERLRTVIDDPSKLKDLGGIPIILESANTNAETLRDRERKTLIAWERFMANAKAANWLAIGKMILWAALGIAAIVVAYNFFKHPAAVTTVVNATMNATHNVTGPTVIV